MIEEKTKLLNEKIDHIFALINECHNFMVEKKWVLTNKLVSLENVNSRLKKLE